MVIPMFQNNEICGVLDIDSTEFAAFNEQVRIALEKFCASLSLTILKEIVEHDTATLNAIVKTIAPGLKIYCLEGREGLSVSFRKYCLN